MIAILKALGEANRFQIVELLLGGPRPVGDMAVQLGLRQPQVSKHLRVLSDAGLVGVRVDAQRRIYALQPEALKELEVWVEKYQRLRAENSPPLDTLLQESKTKEKRRGRQSR
jgi:DNA-binding transcriptional ArsR family regulator